VQLALAASLAIGFLSLLSFSPFLTTPAGAQVSGLPWIQQSLLAPPSGSLAFGSAIATSSNGTTVLVGDPSSNVATVYTENGGSWSSGVVLTPPPGFGSFGTSVALSGNGAVALVGDPFGGGTGMATVYTLTSGVWSSGVPLSAPATAFAFGTSVALSGSGTTALVGDPSGGDLGTGAATVYTYTTSWNNGTELVVPASPSPPASQFGTSVALSNSGTTALVGDPTAGLAGRGDVTSFSGTSWATNAEILPSSAGTGGFGSSVAVSSAGTTAVVGDPTYPATSGSAGIYTGSGTGSGITKWTKNSTLKAPSGSTQFGWAVAITGAGTEAFVGDPTGGGGTGAVNSYSAFSGTWLTTTTATALAIPPYPGAFGSAVAVSRDASSAFVGDPLYTGANSALTGSMTAYSANGRFWSLGTLPALPPNSSSFGTDVSLSSTGATVLEGDPTGDGTVTASGAASVYTYNGSTLSPPTGLTRPSNSISFGTSVAISENGSTAVVGDPGTGSGTATVYTSTGSGWSLGTALEVPSTAFAFGTSVAISASGNEILVGDPVGGNGTGSVTEFTRGSGTWSKGNALLTPANTYSFGTTVALSANGNAALVADLGAPGGGSVIPYTLANGSFSEGNPIPIPAHAAAFGTALALSQTGSVALVGDPTGGSSGTGAATVFTESAGAWSQNASLTPVGAPAQFGASVALSASGLTALVGDPGALIPGTVTPIGTATLYDFSGSWSAGTPFAVTPNAVGFGTAVALSADGTTAAVGDPNGGLSGGNVTVFSLDATTAATSLSASANPSSASFGAPVTYSATVSAGSGTPTGTVRFTAGLTTLCTATLSGAKGSCSASNTPLGMGAVFASYAGDANYTPSTVSAPVLITSPPTTQISVAPTSVTQGATVTYSAIVSPTSGSGTPTGTVAFSTGGTALCTAPLASGSGTCTASNAPVGTDTITGNYSGDSNYSASSSSTSLTVSAPPPSMTHVSVTPTSVTQGATVTYSAKVSPTSGSGTPTGTVAFSTGGTALCTAPLASGSGNCKASNAPVGTDTVTAKYSGDSSFSPSSSGTSLTVNAPVTSPSTSHGYWLVGSDGGIFSFGSAQFYGSMGGITLQRPVVGIVPTRDRGGYWLDASDGGVFSFGDTQFYGSIPGLGLNPAGSGKPNSLNAPIVGMVPSHDQGGYFMVASDGGVFAFGDAHFAGSCPGIGGCAGAAVAVMPDATGNGYWLVTATGNVYTFGDAPNLGAPGPQPSPITSAVATPDGGGYYILDAAGQVFAYGDARGLGSVPPGAVGGFNPASAIFVTSDNAGYWVSDARGGVYTFGDAPNEGSMAGTPLNGSIIAASGS
jgi:hypothetical protein